VRLGALSVYFLDAAPCRCRVTTAEGKEYEVKVLAADPKGARIQYWHAGSAATAPPAQIIWNRPDPVRLRL
jgi:hypothetical protein